MEDEKTNEQKTGALERITNVHQHSPKLNKMSRPLEVSVVTQLAKKECVPCKGGVPPLKGKEIDDLYSQLGADWKVVDAHHLEKEFKFKNFRRALEFTNRVGELAEAQGHHPDIYLTWGKVKLTVWTHKIDGLTESDFVFAAKVEEL
jgi:4a-hydroxytetrahydrobiopterin dehydratase